VVPLLILSSQLHVRYGGSIGLLGGMRSVRVDPSSLIIFGCLAALSFISFVEAVQTRDSHFQSLM